MVQMENKKKSQEDKEKPPVQQYSTLREYFVTTVVCTIFALFVTTYVVHPMTVPTPSMEPTILVGDRLLIDKFTIRNDFVPGPPLTPKHEVKRGDILVFKFPEQPEVLYVKRLIGLPGETIEIRERQVYVDGVAIEEPYKVHTDPISNRSTHAFLTDPKRNTYGPKKVPSGHFFMMGDNRDNSADSRYFGFLPQRHVVGRPLVVFWSYEDDERAYQRTDLVKLYLERIVSFAWKTRWTRTGHIVR
jgi:signal peptidase I